MRYKDSDRDAKAKRASALARPELRMQPGYTDPGTQMPETDRPCTVWSSDENGPYRLPFPVVWDSEHKIWRNANHENPLEVTVIGWNYRTSP